MRGVSKIVLAALTTPAWGEVHRFLVGYFAGTDVNALDFDDSTNSLTVYSNITLDGTSGQKWIALDTDMANLYVATTGYIMSYSIGDDTSLTYQSNVTLSENCTNANYITVSQLSPYAVFATPYSEGCSTLAITVDDAGTLTNEYTEITFSTSSGIHGSDLDAEETFFYSADDTGNGVWTHSYDASSGTITELQQLVAEDEMEPRHLTVHPSGNFVYVVYEAGNSVAVYNRDSSTGLLTFSNTTYSLLPDTITNTTNYWADEVIFSSLNSTTPKYIFAATRSKTVGVPGYVSAFALDADTGAITSQLFLVETTNSGGSSNSVGPTSFSEEYFVIPDSASYFLEIWQIADDGASASAVAHVDLAAGPANTVWLS